MCLAARRLQTGQHVAAGSIDDPTIGGQSGDLGAHRSAATDARCGRLNDENIRLHNSAACAQYVGELNRILVDNLAAFYEQRLAEIVAHRAFRSKVGCSDGGGKAERRLSRARAKLEHTKPMCERDLFAIKNISTKFA